MKNKYDVPYHCYELTLEDGTVKYVDIGCEEDWGDIQEAYDDDCNRYIGWGNDCDGHKKITKVIDMENSEVLDIDKWANYVWSFVKNYSI